MYQILLFSIIMVVSCREFEPRGEIIWRNFKESFHKRYFFSEESRRRLIFEENLKKIADHNDKYEAGLHKYRLGVNQFADLTSQEFAHMMSCIPKTSRQPAALFKPPSVQDVPTAVDWRDQHIVTDVKDQRGCGSCYAFATTGTIEGQWALMTGELVSLSEQNLVDCSGPGNKGCNGGYMTHAYDYVIEVGGIATDESYPYTAKEGVCKFNSSNTVIGATIRDYVNIPAGDEDALQLAVATAGPIAVAVDAWDIQLYKSGVFDDPYCTQEVNHAMLIVGYGVENDKDYWLIKNSWGSDWGEDGYIKMSRNKQNQCGVASWGSYPIVTEKSV